MNTESTKTQEKKLETLEEAAVAVLNEYNDEGFEGAANRLSECQMRLMYIYKSLFDDEAKKDPTAIEICKDIKDCYIKMNAMIRKCQAKAYNWSEDTLKSMDAHAAETTAHNFGDL